MRVATCEGGHGDPPDQRPSHTFASEAKPYLTETEIDRYFADRRFFQFVTSTGRVAYYDPDIRLVACDAHVGNFVRSKGQIVPIDVIISYPTDEMRKCIAAQLGIRVEAPISE
jgi:hypothetical protein